MMIVGDTVRINVCNDCPKMVGKTAKIVHMEHGLVTVRYGRGRPPVNRPNVLSEADVVVVNDVLTVEDNLE